MDAVTPIIAVHLGIEYRGEVLRVERWSPELGRGPGNAFHFKIVLLQERPRTGPPDTVDKSVAICVPASRHGPRVSRIVGEITAAKQAAYLTRRDVDAAAINTALRDRQHDLEGRLISEESARFTKGMICVQDGPGPDPAEIYSDGAPVQWIERLAGWLLARAYPSLPLDTHGLHDPIREDDAGRLFTSIFSQPGADPELLRRLGPTLGLSSPDSSGSNDPPQCQVFPLIRKKISLGPAIFSDVHHYLAYDVGLTGQLASLFLLMFIHHERPEHQIQLIDDAAMFMADGGPLLGSRLTPDLIPLLAWDGDLASNASSIGPESAPRFIDTRHHLSVLCPELASSRGDGADAALSHSLAAVALEIATASRILDSLNTLESRRDGLSSPMGETGELRAALARLGQISGDRYAEIYDSVRAVYPALNILKDDLETMRQLVKLDEDSKEIFEAQRYLAAAHVPSTRFPSLAVDRETLLTGLSPSRLTRSRGRGWTAIARDTEGFKIRYTQTYREHHRQFHDALTEYQAGLLTARKKASALGLLNTIRELGPPAGAGLEKDLAALPLGPSPCSFQGAELDLSKEPICPECGISLEQTVPSAALARLAPQVDMVMGAKTQELSRLLVEKALAGKADDRWQEFLQIVQASDLSSLANTLDVDLVSFIRQILD